MEEAKDKEWDLIVCPGGEWGCRVLQKSISLIELLKRHHKEKKLIGAICAAPALVLNAADIVPKKLTCYPTPSNINLFPPKAISFESDVVIDENIITSAGPATALHFALQLGASLFENDQDAYELGRQLLEKDYVYEYEERKNNEINIDVETISTNTEKDGGLKKTNQNSAKKTRPKRVANSKGGSATKKSPAKTPVQKGTVAKKPKVTKKVTPAKKKETAKTSNKKEDSSTSFDYGWTKRGTKDIFRQLIIPRMLKVGFRMEDGPRIHDCYFFPPGVTRRNGKKRQDYFDSTKGIVVFMENHSDDDIIYSKIIEYFQKCCLEFEEYKQSTKGNYSSTDTPIRTLQRRVLKKYPHLKI